MQHKNPALRWHHCVRTRSMTKTNQKHKQNPFKRLPKAKNRNLHFLIISIFGFLFLLLVVSIFAFGSHFLIIIIRISTFAFRDFYFCIFSLFLHFVTKKLLRNGHVTEMVFSILYFGITLYVFFSCIVLHKVLKESHHACK